MESQFIETMQKIEGVTRSLAKMGVSTLDEAVERIKIISTFFERYGELGIIFEHFKDLESKLYMLREMLTVEEAANYLGVSKSQIYLMTSNKEITYYKPSGKVIYIDKRELDDLRRRNIIYSNREMSSCPSAVASRDEKPRSGKKAHKQ